MKNINAILAGSKIPPKNALWLDGQVAKYFKNGKWISIGSDSDVTDSIVKLENGQGFINITSSTESKTVLDLLNNIDSSKPFYINIGEGFGTATWNSTSGGKAFITEANGHAKSYTISKDGVITQGKDIDLSNPDTDLFIIVSELPKTDIKTGKLYCIKNTSSDDTQNTYTEYCYINNSWEKMGEFKADPDLSTYAKLNSPSFTTRVTFPGKSYCINSTSRPGLQTWASATNTEDYVWTGYGSVIPIGTSETFTFTLDDGSVVTKNIRVLS